jgi:DNA-binding NarL/FixJ family response regulator
MRALQAAPIRVLVADSTHMRAQLLAKALGRRADFAVVSCRLTPEAIIQELAACAADILLVNSDLRDHIGHDLAIVRRTHLEHPAVHKILLVDSYDRDLVVRAFRSGVRGIFSSAEADLRALCKCIQSIHQGQVWANAEQLGYLLAAISRVPALQVVNAQGFALVTPREEQVVALVANGLSNREIAQELGLREDTIKTYLFRIFEELVLYAMNHGQSQPAEWLAAEA